MEFDKQDALLVVDVQNDFIAGGALAVAGGDLVVPVINRIAGFFATRVFTRDWHPANHVSFSAQPRFVDQSWPVHCVQNTWGAQFHPLLNIRSGDRIVSKGDDPHHEAYSAFHNTDLAHWLKASGIRRIYIAGLTTDYCVLTTTLDGLAAGFEVLVLEDAIAGVDVPAGSAAAALQKMRDNGAQIISSARLIN